MPQEDQQNDEKAAGESTDAPFPLSTLRHSVAHLMASAVAELWPEAKFGFGPSIEHGFYYDIELPEPLSDKHLRKIEKRMRQIAKRAKSIDCEVLSRDEAKARLAEAGQTYKVEAVDLIPEDEEITFYTHAGWSDLCEGPHIDRFNREMHFKLLSIAGSYWRGDEKNPMLTRIYGTAFWTKAELDAHLAWLDEVKKRDHRRIGTDQDLYSLHQEAGPGFVFWHPRLGEVRKEIEDFWWAEHRRRGYRPVYTPHIAREELFAVSGHLENYGDMMYAPMELDSAPYRAKPMNCPGHILIYRNRGRSYRELPLRWAELGTVYRYEKSGVVHGMLRVRGFTQDDAHIFCTPEQLAAEIAGVLELIQHMLETFGYSYTAYLATRPDDKTIGEDDAWERATKALEEGADRIGLPLEMDEGGGAFYGPKIDFKIKDALGREWQNSTVQCDFNLPERFDLHYTDRDGSRQRPIMVHRAILGSLERFVGGLIEHFGGKFPFWLAPEQLAIIPIREEHGDYARRLTEELERETFRVRCLDEPTHMNKRIKTAQQDQIPFMLIVGEREAAENTVAVRPRGTRAQATMPFSELLEMARQLRDQRTLELPVLESPEKKDDAPAREAARPS